MSDKKQSLLVRLTGLWKNESKAGQQFLAGTVSPSSRLLVFANENKRKESDPDYIAYLAPNEKKEKEQESLF